MGLDESKMASNVHLHKLSFSVPEHSNAKPWSLIHQCTLEQWKRGLGESSNFSDRVFTCSNQVYKDCSPAFCINKQSLINVRKSSPVFHFRKRCKLTKMAEHFEYNHIPAHLSSIQNFHFKSVLCFHGGLVVLHLARNMVTQFGLVDLHINKFLGVFGKQLVEFNVETVVGEISPDESRCLIKLPSARTSRVFVFQLYDLRSKDLLKELILPSSNSIFVFDPRFTSSRLAVTNFEVNSVNSLSLVNSNSWERRLTNHQVMREVPAISPYLLRLTYSKAGHLLIAVCTEEGACRCNREWNGGSRRNLSTQGVGGSVTQAGNGVLTGAAGSVGGPLVASGNDRTTPCFLLIFHADTLRRLRIIKFDRYTCTLHSCPTNFSPVMSRCGGRLALVCNLPELPPTCDLVLVYQLPPPPSLQAIARQRLVQVYTDEQILRLGLPNRLLSFVRFHPSVTCAGSCISRSSSTVTSRNI